MKSYFLATLATAALLGMAGCHSSEKQRVIGETSQTPDKGTLAEDHTESLFGTYKGTFPCADCPGKNISLSVMDDGTYKLQYEYLETGEGVIEECGVYHILNDTIVETVTPSSGDKTYYVYVHGNLVLSDSLGVVNKGELADFYVLKKHE